MIHIYKKLPFEFRYIGSQNTNPWMNLDVMHAKESMKIKSHPIFHNWLQMLEFNSDRCLAGSIVRPLAMSLINNTQMNMNSYAWIHEFMVQRLQPSFHVWIFPIHMTYVFIDEFGVTKSPDGFSQQESVSKAAEPSRAASLVPEKWHQWRLVCKLENSQRDDKDAKN